MARNKNTVSATQLDPELMTAFKDRIEVIGVTELARITGLSRWTIYKWMDGEATEPETETKILVAIDQDTNIRKTKEQRQLEYSQALAEKLNQYAASC